MLLSSIYDRDLDALPTCDFSRPLFVQATRAPEFNELLDVLHHRLRLPPQRSTILVSPTYPGRPWWPGTMIVNPEPQVSERTISLLAADAAGFSSVIVASAAPFRDPMAAMQGHGNIACLCHALEPTPALVVNRDGQAANPRDVFLYSQRTVGPLSMTGSMWLTDEEAGALVDAAATCPDGHVVEIGRYCGGSATLLAATRRAAGRPGIVSIDIARLSCAEYFIDVNGLSGDVRLLDGDSVAIASRWPEMVASTGIGLLFIDANHTYEGVVRDLLAWAPFVVEGGTIALHDAGLVDTGIAKAAYYHLRTRSGYARFRQARSMLLCERMPSAAAQIAPAA